MRRAASSSLSISWCLTANGKKKITSWPNQSCHWTCTLMVDFETSQSLTWVSIFSRLSLSCKEKLPKYTLKISSGICVGIKPQSCLKYIFRLICFSKTYCLLSNEVYVEWSHFLRASDFLGLFQNISMGIYQDTYHFRISLWLLYSIEQSF